MDHDHHAMMAMNSSTANPHAGHNMAAMSTTMNMMGTMQDHNQGMVGMMHNHGMMPMTNDSCMPGMIMYFHTGNCEYILFEAIKITTPAQMGAAVVVIFFLSMLYEALKFLREYLVRRANKKFNYQVSNGAHKASSQEVTFSDTQAGFMDRMLSCSHFIQTLLHMLQVFISYLLMLIFMAYNVWLCLAIILGAGAGYFLFGWRRAVVVDINEHCH